MKAVTLIICLIAAVSALGCVSNNNSSNQNINLTYRQNVTGSSQGNTIQGELETTVNCGSQDCFQQRFSNCEPATLSSKLTETIVYYYEILGPSAGGCSVKSKFTANPNPEWVNKEMTCLYDNTKDFETAIKDTSKCIGPLSCIFTTGNTCP